MRKVSIPDFVFEYTLSHQRQKTIKKTFVFHSLETKKSETQSLSS